MHTYPKINGIYKRYTDGSRKGRFIMGEYSCPEFDYLKNDKWIWTEKIDGTSIRIIFYTHSLCEDSKRIQIKGRTDNAEIPVFLLNKLKEIFTLEKMKEVFAIGDNKPDICLYGEGCGFRIQKNGEKYVNGQKDNDFILFDIKIGKYWLERKTLEEIADKLNIRLVPKVGRGSLSDAIGYIRSYPKSVYGDFIMEGIVCKPEIQLFDRFGQRIITKIKVRDFRDE
jgi:hypothetical protein